MAIRFEDFILPCERCGGEGRIREEGGSRGGMGMHWTKEGPCERCGGAGTLLTEEGKELLKVIQHLKYKHHL